MPDENLLRTLLWTILLLPFVHGIGWLLAGRRFNAVAGLASAVLTLAGLALSVWVMIQTGRQPVTLRTDWIALQDFSLPIAFRLDSLTLLMLGVVHFIALLVQLYSTSYLHDEPDKNRYFGFLGVFVGSMLGIVLAGNLIGLYIFWELVGLSSYLLIGFWFRKPEAAAAAKKAFVMNRIGDAGFLIGIFLVYYTYGSTEFSEVLDQPNLATPFATLTGLCLFCGCVGKSAQFPLSTWLPDAMEGPTPVSALIHAATMVAAGIFLLARIHPLLTPDALTVIIVIGLITMLVSAYSAVFQTDIKKVLAYSTVSQLGLMVVGMGTGNVSGALFHLTTHAFFKAGLFLAAGSVIHGVHTQDMRRMGGLRKAMPVTFIGYLVCAAALAGVPLFSGFLSKEALLTGSFDWAQNRSGGAILVPALALISSGLTAVYMARQAHLIFFGKYRNVDLPFSRVHESDWRMTGPVVLLAALSLGLTFSRNPFSATESWFFRLFAESNAFSAGDETLGLAYEHLLIALVSVGVVTVGLLTGYFLPATDPKLPEVRLLTPDLAPAELADRWVFRPFHTFARRLHRFERRFIFWFRNRELHLDTLHWKGVIQPVLTFSDALSRFDAKVVDGLVHLVAMGNVVAAHVVGWLDRNLVDGLVNGAAWLAGRFGTAARQVQSGRAQSYIVAAVMGLLLIIWLIL
ncbi:NADH-quinone oxidoreductase subunit L [Tellurirhabdus rosea]|uniref:NADH-quinone oxidoreductase subunit L n=1 Tax=Tellurirhabdus rosea TaxID=2674997 RepID=UPI0022577AA9|nr:NADH-quinone oxidoreductase subunit L [Tellurirhabdus rosea]